ncbi:MAG: restriction endonuclease subunit S, partial [Desulfuromonadales bacterium]|nr:restriction endonuclease subunit S [Desulfuromonadales bacterium]
IKEAQDIATISIGKTPPRKEAQWFSKERHDNVVWVSIKNLGNSGMFIGNSSEYLVPESIEKFNVKVIPKDSVILSFKLTIGRVAIAQSELATNEAIAHFVTPKVGLTKEYIFNYLKNFDYGRLGSTSSIATAVNSKLIKAMPFLVPNRELLGAHQKTCIDWFDQVSLISYQTSTLSNLRDTLLPKLLSGQLRIPDAEKLIEGTI